MPETNSSTPRTRPGQQLNDQQTKNADCGFEIVK